jgi:hypothetical protein
MVFADIEFFPSCVNVVELSIGVCLVQSLIAFEGAGAILAGVNDGDVIEQTLPSFGMCFQRFDHQPCVGVSLSYLRPIHGVTSDNLLPSFIIAQYIRRAKGWYDLRYALAAASSDRRFHPQCSSAGR